MDNESFYGGVLHVCYAPEYESVQDTREKLQDRRKTVAARIRKLGNIWLSYTCSVLFKFAKRKLILIYFFFKKN